MQKPFLSIVICTYNGELFLKEQLISLLGQTYTAFEIIAIDDCSTDSSFNILKEFSQNSKLKAYRNENNIGLNRNFQLAIQKAKGDYIALCDQDDIWNPEKLEIMVNQIDGSLLYFHDSVLIDHNGSSLFIKLSDRFHLISNPNPLSFISQNCVTGHACMFDRHLIDYLIFPFPEHIYYDNWLGYMSSLNGRIHYIDQCLVRYRVHKTNLSVSHKKKNKLDENLLMVCYNQLDDFYKSTPENIPFKTFLRRLRDTYKSHCFLLSIHRIFLFLQHCKTLTAFRKKNIFRKLIFCFKMSYKPLPNYFE
jgi:glycosyltransferase involved in cell wall biosynthesis